MKSLKQIENEYLPFQPSFSVITVSAFDIFCIPHFNDEQVPDKSRVSKMLHVQLGSVFSDKPMIKESGIIDQNSGYKGNLFLRFMACPGMTGQLKIEYWTAEVCTHPCTLKF